MGALLRTDLIWNLRVWGGAFIVVMAGTVAAGIPATLIETALNTSGVVALALLAVAGTLIALTAIAIAVVLSAVLRASIEVRRRSFALWQVVGMTPAQVTNIVGGQGAVVSLCGASAGAIVASLVCPPSVAVLLTSSNGFGAVKPILSAFASAVVAASVAVVGSGIGFFAARRAGSTPPLLVLRDAAAPRHRYALRLVASGLLVLTAASMLAGIPSALPTGAAQSVLIGPVVIASVALSAPLFLPAFIRLWTQVLPERYSPSWLVARAWMVSSIRRNSARTSAFVVAIGLPWSFIAAQHTVATALGHGASLLDLRSLGLLLGGPTVLAAAGGAAGVYIGAGERVMDSRLVTALGGSRATRLLVATLEVVIEVVSASLLAGIVTIVVVTCEAAVVASTASVTLVPNLGVGVAATVSCLAVALLARVLAAVPQISSAR